MRNNGSAAQYEVATVVNYSVTLDAPATGVTLSPNASSPRVAGQTVAFTAQGQGGTGVYEYQFLRRSPSSTVWTVAQDYGPSAIWVWDTTGMTIGTHAVRVNVRSSGSVVQFEAQTVLTYAVIQDAPATGATLTADLASPQVAGTSVGFTAQGIGGSGSYEYSFQYKLDSSPTWTTSQPYSSTATWAWDTTGLAAAVYTVKVQVRSQGSSSLYEAQATVPFAVVSSALASGVTLTSAPATTAPIGTSVTFTAGATGGAEDYEYRFFRKDPGSTVLAMVQDYSSNPILAWDTISAVAGKYTIMVHVRHAGSPYVKEAYRSVYYTLTAP